MSDLLEHQPTAVTRRRRAMAIVTALTLAGGGLLLRESANKDHPEAERSPAPAASSTAPQPTEPAPNPTTPAAGPGSAGRPWPRAQGACDNDAALPLVAVKPLLAHTGLRVFVGGSGLRLVDIDTGRVQRVAALAEDRQVTELTAAAGRLYALAQPCSSDTSASDVLSVNRDRLVARQTVVRGVDDLLAGAGRAWAFRYPDRSAAELVLHPILGGPPLRMPAGFAPYEVTRRSFLGTLDRPADQVADQRPFLAAVDRTSHQVVRPLARGDFMVGADGFILYNSCVAGKRCLLTQRRSDGTERQFALPRGRVPYAAGVLSDDRRLAAFQLVRSEPDPAYDAGHPGHPSDVAVLDLVTEKLQVLRGVELAPKSEAALAFSRDSRWLLISLNEGDHARLLVWRPGWDRPRQSHTSLPGTILYSAPVIDAARAS